MTASSQGFWFLLDSSFLISVLNFQKCFSTRKCYTSDFLDIFFFFAKVKRHYNLYSDFFLGFSKFYKMK